MYVTKLCFAAVLALFMYSKTEQLRTQEKVYIKDLVLLRTEVSQIQTQTKRKGMQIHQHNTTINNNK